ncbi:hypothetical protein C4588_01790 [Candidatus Parcubacteria bacterium]|nr:MAG: hypothetical protein C4588_01790 [Candidatus Parcubacteria bacterium]
MLSVKCQLLPSFCIAVPTDPFEYPIGGNMTMLFIIRNEDKSRCDWHFRCSTITLKKPKFNRMLRKEPVWAILAAGK